MEISLQCFANLVEEGVCDHKGAVRHEVVEGETIKCLVTRLGIPDNEIKTAFLNGRAVDLRTALHNRDRLTLVPAAGAAREEVPRQPVFWRLSGDRRRPLNPLNPSSNRERMVGAAAGSRVNKAEEASRGVERKGGRGVGKQRESLRRAVVLLATVLFLAGCAVQPKIWFQPGVTDEQTQRDYDECLRRAEAAVKASPSPGYGALGSYGASGGAIAATEAAETRSCMEGKGYRLVDRGGPRPPSSPTY